MGGKRSFWRTAKHEQYGRHDDCDESEDQRVAASDAWHGELCCTPCAVGTAPRNVSVLSSFDWYRVTGIANRAQIFAKFAGDADPPFDCCHAHSTQ
jgi:hypothetical protein